MGRRIHPDRKSDNVSEDDRCERNYKSHQETITDYIFHWKVICKGISHVSLEKPGDPVEVLLPKGAIETILNLKEMYLGQIGSFARALELGDISGEIVARGKVDDNKNHHADRDQRRDHYQNPMNEITEHSNSVLLANRDLRGILDQARVGPDRPCRSQRRRFRPHLGHIKPETIRLVDPEKSARIPVVDPLLGDVAELGVHHDRLEYTSTSADRKDFFGPYPEHGTPDPRLIRLDCGIQPLPVEFLEPDCRRQIGRFAGSALCLIILPPFRPFELLLARRRKFQRGHCGGSKTILDAFVDRHHCFTREYPTTKQGELRRLGKKPDPDLAPGVADKLEHVPLLSRVTSIIDNYLHRSAGRQQTHIVSASFSEPDQVEKTIGFRHI